MRLLFVLGYVCMFSIRLAAVIWIRVDQHENEKFLLLSTENCHRQCIWSIRRKILNQS